MESKESKLKVLIADDDPLNRDMLTKLMSKLGYGSDTVSTADDEINAIRQNKQNPDKYCLVITDNKMGDGHEDSGLYATEQIRNHSKVPIIFMSGDLTEDLTDDTSKKALKLGADALIKKPFDIYNVLNKAKQLSEQYIKDYLQG